MKSNKSGCVIYLIVIFLNITVGAWSVIEILSWFGKTIPMIASIALGLIAGEVSIPVAIVGCILKAFGVF
jgi:hypothetical protein